MIFVLLLSCFSNFEITSNIRIKLPNGQLLIGNRKIEENKILYEFLGVPFAQAPIGEKRFEFPYNLNDTLPTDVYDATQQKSSCSQYPDTTFNREFIGAEIWNAPDETSEDCLYMNMWVPIRPEYDTIFVTESNKVDTSEIKFVNLTILEMKNEEKLTTLFWIYGGLT